MICKKPYKLVVKIFLGAIFLCYGIMLAMNIATYAGGADSSGYLNAANLISHGEIKGNQRIVGDLTFPQIPQYSYIPLGFSPSDNNKMVPTYPLGLPILIALASFFTSLSKAGSVIMWLHAMGSIILVYKISRHANLERPWAIAAAIMLAINPLFISYSVQLMSDMPALFWDSAAMLAALKSRKQIN